MDHPTNMPFWFFLAPNKSIAIWMNSVLRSPGGKYVDLVLCDVHQVQLFCHAQPCVICVSQPHTKLPDFNAYPFLPVPSIGWQLCEDCFVSCCRLQIHHISCSVWTVGRRPTHPTWDRQRMQPTKWWSPMECGTGPLFDWSLHHFFFATSYRLSSQWFASTSCCRKKLFWFPCLHFQKRTSASV